MPMATHTSPITTDTTCYHCGEPCQQEQREAHGHTFCCAGCQTVYEILQENNLCKYYDMGEKPGSKNAQSDNQNRFAFLDQPELAKEVLEFSEDQLAQARFFIPVIHCSSCIWLLEHLTKLNPAVVNSQVHFIRKEVSITFRPQEISLRQLAELLQRIGYMPEINHGNTQGQAKDRTRKPNRRLSLQIGVAGFCFGNIMLLSLPEYLDVHLAMEPLFKQFFAILNLVLGIPALIYSSRDYFTAAWRGIRSKFISIDVPIALGMAVLFGRSAYEIISQTGAGYMDSFTGLVFFLLIGKWFQTKTYQALSFDRDYTSYFPVAVTVLADGQEFSLPIKDLKQGDRLLVRNQELIPADATLISEEARIDYSFITGESAPVYKQAGDRIQAGGRQVGPAIELVVDKAVAQSRLTQLWNQDVFTKDRREGLPTMIDRVSHVFTWAILSIAVLTAITWFILDASQVAATVTAVLIVACPCALALTLPFAYGHTLRWMGRGGLYLKSADVVERMGQLKTLVFDKTGTITQRQNQEITWEGAPLSGEEKNLIRAAARQSAHPLSQALYHYLPDTGKLTVLLDFAEYAGKGLRATALSGTTLVMGSGRFVAGTQAADQQETRVYIALEGKVRGSFVFGARYRSGYANLLQELKENYQLHLLSGDRDQERTRLAPFFRELRFEQSPTDKLRYLEGLEESAGPTGMVGDGLNDAGALRQAHVGISIADEVYHFAPACDAILDAKELPKLANHLKLARQTRRVVFAAFGISFAYNIVGLSFAVTGLLTPLVAAILMPLSSITTVGFITLAINALARKLKD